MNTQKQIFLIVVLFFTLVGGCAAYSMFDLPHRAAVQADYQQKESVTRGALLFANNCRTCHGNQGQGGIGPQLNKDAFRDQDPLVLAANQQLLRTTLSCGRAGTLMPAWLKDNGGALNSEQITHLIDLITAPTDPSLKDEQGNPTTKGWQEALEFAHNLNHETSALIGGDTLDTIAKAHQIGYQKFADANGLGNYGFNTILKTGTELKIPGFSAMPNGYTYTVYKDNETIAKIVDSQHYGAVLISDLNHLPYKFTVNKEKAEFVQLDETQKDVPPKQLPEVPGLFPGTKLKLPAGSPYVVKSGDTLDSIAAQHGISASEIQQLNSQALAGAAPDKPIDAERKLKLPNGTKVIVQPGQTAGVIAEHHGMTLPDLQKLNPAITATTPVAAGQQLVLPDNTSYTIQPGDTIESVAREHGLSADALASANGLKPTDHISPDVVLKMPDINSYTVTGQTLEDLAKTYSNGDAAEFAKTNGLPSENVVLRVGQKLALPDSVWGSAPPDTKNNGTACVQHAVPNSVFATLPGVGTATQAPAITQPTTVTKTLKVTANTVGSLNDFTFIEDGTEGKPNEGVTLIAKGTAVEFDGVSGLHTVTINGKKDDGDLKAGTSRTITFNDAGQFKITCDYHPDMFGDIFVQ